MADGKKSFVLYCDLIHDFKLLLNSDAGILFMSILKYVNGEHPPVPINLHKLYNKIIAGIEYEWSKYNPETKKYHWNYKGGITPENKAIRNGEKIKIWRLSVFERDSYSCQKCGKVGGVLHAHHIKEFSKFPELRFNIDNGLTLCKKCHNLIHKKNG